MPKVGTQPYIWILGQSNSSIVYRVINFQRPVLDTTDAKKAVDMYDKCLQINSELEQIDIGG